MRKYKVVLAWLKDDGTEFEPIYAENSEQAEGIALAMLKDKRLRNIERRQCVSNQ